ncbi:sigma-54-dependent transcriptional regulator [Pararhodonellum marinum]|uniref:sigma-54-dependent transcriptional regulator n=1 Tax=Pararhodonellum marinum TaxID=2755358 RepID=UPI00188FF7FE|nr:sigma-54 dependent transcriptional regulator [Pararhodonellum marinum]
MHKVLLVEDDLTYSNIIKKFLEKNNFQVSSVPKIADFLSLINSFNPDLVITDFRLPDGTGIEVLSHTKKTNKNIGVILITSYSDIRTAVKAMKMGAHEYITKPINPDELLMTVKEAIKKSQAVKTGTPSPPPPNISYIVGKDAPSLQIEEHIRLVAPSDLSVVIIGETGTGKEYIAKRIHELSDRQAGPFIAIDCGALPHELAGSELFGHIKGAFTGALDNKTGHFEVAKGGTIFLDEVGNLSYENQIMLLRALQERKIRKVGGTKEIPIDVRILCATNEDLKENISRGTFREDLYHRLNEFSIEALPLRDRGEDLWEYANQFLDESNQILNKEIKGFSEEVREIFNRYPWPGNLRELKNIIKRSVLLSKSDMIEKTVLPSDIYRTSLEPTFNELPQSQNLKLSLMEQEKQIIMRTLEEVRFNKSKAAKKLNMDRKTLYNKMEKYGIE